MEKAEIEKIRKKYMPVSEDKLSYIRKLDKSVSDKACLWSIVVGVIGALIMGTGMSLCTVWGGIWMVVGIIIGVIGMAVLVVAYPLYVRILKKERERIAPEILRLTEELMD